MEAGFKWPKISAFMNLGCIQSFNLLALKLRLLIGHISWRPRRPWRPASHGLKLALSWVEAACKVWPPRFETWLQTALEARLALITEAVSWQFYGNFMECCLKNCPEVTRTIFETSSPYLESGATFHSLRSCKRTRMLRILVCSTLNKIEIK